MRTLSLDALAEDPARIQSLPAPIQADLYRQAAQLEAALRAYLLTTDRPPRAQAAQAPHDQALTLRETADILRVSRDTLYRKWRRLDFAYRDPLDGQIKFRRGGVERYVESLRGRPPEKGRI